SISVPMKRQARRISSELTVPISLGSREPTELFDPDELEKKAIQGPLRRNAPLLLVLVAVFAFAPSLSQLLKSYRAVVLESKDGRILLIESAEPPPPPRWASADGIEAGSVVEKAAGRWSPVAVDPAPKDAALLRYHERWTRAYEGTISKIYPPAAPGSPSVAVVTLEDGSTLSVSLWSQDLAEAAVGRRLKKEPSSWEPDLIEP
ncbi:MAG: hypothetical protein AAFX94_12285, partial [Myxococcota bacterium]